MDAIPRTLLIRLIDAGLQAPSADNSQPWRCSLTERGFDLWLDRSRLGLFFDADGVASRQSCGAFIENVTTLAGALGFDTDVQVNEAPTLPVAQLRFTAVRAAREVEEARRLIYGRHTDRRFYEFGRRLPTATGDRLRDAVTGNGFRLTLLTEPAARRAVCRTIRDVDRIRFRHETIHKDLHRELRYGADAERTRDGLDAATLGLLPPELAVLRQLAPWTRMRRLCALGFHRYMAWRGTWLPLLSSSAFALLTHTGPACPVEAGRRLERLWLRANGMGLSIQPLGALPLLLARLRRCAGEGLSLVDREELRRLERDLAHQTPGFTADRDEWVMVFRLGFASSPAVRSRRRAAASLRMDTEWNQRPEPSDRKSVV
jgi:hypothetical protein